MKSQRTTTIVIISVLGFLLLIFGVYFLLRHRFLANVPIVNINKQIVISKIPLFSDSANKTQVSDIELLTPKSTTQSFELLVENNSSQSYSNFTISKSDLSSSNGDKIPASAIDERIVHSWPQKLVDWSYSGNTFTPTPVIVDELLVNYDPGADAVTLMTLHSAKGLEFPVVFIIGMEEGLLPHAKSTDEEMEIEEERRLCYVGITRAKEKLYLIYAGERIYFGNPTMNLPSRFLDEIPKDVKEEI